jgi:hypothetical protein
MTEPATYLITGAGGIGPPIHPHPIELRTAIFAYATIWLGDRGFGDAQTGVNVRPGHRDAAPAEAVSQRDGLP